MIWDLDQVPARGIEQIKEWYAEFPVKASAAPRSVWAREDTDQTILCVPIRAIPSPRRAWGIRCSFRFESPIDAVRTADGVEISR